MGQQSEQEDFVKQQVKETVRAGMSGSTLKIIAIITMLIDHIAASLIDVGILSRYNSAGVQGRLNLIVADSFYRNMNIINDIMRMIGRLGFPLFCFLLVEGFNHTRNFKKYALRMLAFCFISEIPFDMAFSAKFVNLNYQNVYFTLFIGLVVMAGLKKFEDGKSTNRVFQVLIVVAGMVVASILKTDYSWFGVIFIVILYVFRNREFYRNLIGGISIVWELTAPLAFIFMHLYNGKRGLNLKYVFYLFYPVHLFILGCITMFVLL